MKGQGQGAAATEVWALSGSSLGPLKRRITSGKDVFETSDRFRSADQVLRFWATFAAGK